jgi:NAD(P)-dependent dehydrogenase (short-subunit alcohol dehydrogenase family)
MRRRVLAADYFRLKTMVAKREERVAEAMAMAGRHVLVTGGSRGLGRAIAAAFRHAGAHVTITGRSREALEAACSAGAASAFRVVDATDETAVLAMSAALVAERPVDVLVANAGAGESAPFLKADAAMFRRMIELNLFGVVHAVRGVLPSMLERRSGRVIAIASTAGLKGYAYVGAYAASKHAVIGLVKSLALETAANGVTVNAVCPGYSDTEMTGGTVANIAAKTGRSEAEALADILKDKPLRRLIRPEEVAAACLYLAGDGAAAVTGAALPVAGAEV